MMLRTATHPCRRSLLHTVSTVTHRRRRSRLQHGSHYGPASKRPLGQPRSTQDGKRAPWKELGRERERESHGWRSQKQRELWLAAALVVAAARDKAGAATGLAWCVEQRCEREIARQIEREEDDGAAFGGECNEWMRTNESR